MSVFYILFNYNTYVLFTILTILTFEYLRVILSIYLLLLINTLHHLIITLKNGLWCISNGKSPRSLLPMFRLLNHWHFPFNNLNYIIDRTNDLANDYHEYMYGWDIRNLNSYLKSFKSKCIFKQYGKVWCLNIFIMLSLSHKSLWHW